MAGTIVKIKQSAVAGRLPTHDTAASTDIVQGELALNTADKKLYSKDSSGTVFEIGAGSGGTAGANEIVTTEFTTSASSTTTFSVAYSASNDHVNVYFNGVWLPPSDFTATNGTTVVLDSAAVAGTEVVIQVIKALNLANGSDITEYEFTASANQTTFAISGGYVTGTSDIEVYVNGVKIPSADFTATNDTQVVLGSAAAVNDQVAIRVVRASLLTSAVNQTSPTGAGVLPIGTTAQRPGSPLAGYLRWNSTLHRTEVYNNNTSAWGDVTPTTQQVTVEEIQDAIGLTITGNTETGIAVTYDDAGNKLNFVVASQTANDFTNTLKTKLDNIEAAADVTDATNVTAAGALMDSELAGLAAVKATTGTFLTADQTKLDAIEASATADQTSADIRGLVAIDEDNMSSDSATKLPTQQSVKAYVDTQVATVPVGDITSVVAGTGLTGGGTSGDVTVNVIGGTGITANADDIAIDSTVATLTGTQTMSAKTLTSPVFNTGVSGSAILDEDNFASNSATKIATQQSIKAYVDAAILTEDNTDEIVEGSSNLYHTTARARASISVTDSGGDGSLAYNSTSGVVTYTGPSAAEARAHISVTDAGGDGSAAYNSSTGVITYTGPSAAEVRAHLSAGTGVTYSGGAFSIGQAVATDSDVTFDDVVVSGNLTINGTTTTAASTNTTIADKLIELGNGQSGSPSGDLGLVFERGSSANAFIGFDESTDKFTVGTGTFTGASTGNLSITTGTLVANIEAATVVTTGNITVGGTVDGRDMQTDGTKLDAIEASATADQTGAQIKTAYQAESSAFTDSQFSKLANIEALADVTDATNVNAAGALMLSDTTTAGLGIVIDEDNMASDIATKVPTQQSVKAYVDAQVATHDHLAEMAGTMDDITNGATFVKTANNFTDVEKTSLATMEDNADVTDAANVEAAGAVMESGANASAKIPNGTTAQRDGSPSAGFFRWNTTTSSAEIYDGSAWGLVGGGNTTGKVMWEHSYTVAENYEITNGNNAVTAGPITINSGASVTVPSGSSWAII